MGSALPFNIGSPTQAGRATQWLELSSCSYRQTSALTKVAATANRCTCTGIRRGMLSQSCRADTKSAAAAPTAAFDSSPSRGLGSRGAGGVRSRVATAHAATCPRVATPAEASFPPTAGPTPGTDCSALEETSRPPSLLASRAEPVSQSAQAQPGPNPSPAPADAAAAAFCVTALWRSSRPSSSCNCGGAIVNKASSAAAASAAPGFRAPAV